MTLEELIKYLEGYPRDIVTKGLTKPHSYRGYYDELAFEPCEKTTIGAMIQEAKGAIGSTYEGWKGGEYKMKKDTTVYLARRGDIGSEISEVLLDALLGQRPLCLDCDGAKVVKCNCCKGSGKVKCGLCTR